MVIYSILKKYFLAKIFFIYKDIKMFQLPKIFYYFIIIAFSFVIGDSVNGYFKFIIETYVPKHEDSPYYALTIWTIYVISVIVILSLAAYFLVEAPGKNLTLNFEKRLEQNQQWNAVKYEKDEKDKQQIEEEQQQLEKELSFLKNKSKTKVRKNKKN